MSTLNLGDSLIMNSDITVNGGEVKTGATYNGRPVYAQAKSGTLVDGGSYCDVAMNFGANISEFVSVNFNVLYTGYSICFGGGWYLSATDYGRIYYATGNKLIYVRCASTYNGSTATVFAYYTKTTD